MANELDTSIRRGLEAHYRELSDGELLDLAASPDELTDVAQQVLRVEMGARGLKADVPSDGQAQTRWASDAFADDSKHVPGSLAPILGSVPDVAADAQEGGTLARGEVLLRTFHDAIELGFACEHLEQAGMGFRVEDVSQPSNGIDGYAPVALNLIVAKGDRERAMVVLRTEMGLFPLQEVAEPDAVVDDGTVSQVGYFATREDAEAIAAALEEAHLWHRVVANPEGSAENEDAYVVEVREVDLMRAGDVVEKVFG